MPRGGGRGGRRGWGQLALFLRPGILLLLREDPSHGYNLIEDLRRQGIIDEDLDAGIVYRYLRDMEEQGMLLSEWETSGPGVPRKVYRLTPLGEEFVHGCMQNLQRTRQRLGDLFQIYRRNFSEEDS
ncbi:MAG: helix-turn-helix transcriptional regulator [Chloroflexia bacterium]|nr:helix-turn-helix transcriptional regulator [Chloroflexia bacterium]